jgi:hypothetical protein
MIQFRLVTDVPSLKRVISRVQTPGTNNSLFSLVASKNPNKTHNIIIQEILSFKVEVP